MFLSLLNSLTEDPNLVVGIHILSLLARQPEMQEDELLRALIVSDRLLVPAILTRLCNADIVMRADAEHGYRLRRPPSEISLWDIVISLRDTTPDGDEMRRTHDGRNTPYAWIATTFSKHTAGLLAQINLAELAVAASMPSASVTSDA